MLKLRSPATVLLLASLTALGPLATDMYLPALPAIAEDLGAGIDQAQLTLSFYTLGFALAQIFVGPLADRFGRKPVMIGGLGLFAIASFICAVAQNIELLLFGRFLQALGGAAGPVLGRATVRDIYEPHEGARILSYMAIAMALAPALAPLAGSALLLVTGWPSIFVTLGAGALAVSAIIALALPEPLAPELRQSIRPRVIAGNFAMLVRDRTFVGYALTNGLAWAGLFSFLSGSPFVLIDFMGVSPAAYGVYFGIGVIGFMLGSAIGGRFGHRLGSIRAQRLGAWIALAGGVLMAGFAWGGVYNPWVVVLPYAIFLCGVSILMPQTMAGALAGFPQCAGSASSLFGFFQMSLGAVFGIAVGQLHDGTSRTMATVIAVSALSALICQHWLVNRPRTAAREVAATE